MDYFSIQTVTTNNVVEQEKKMATDLHCIAENVSSILGQLSGNSALNSNLRSELNSAGESISTQQGNMARLSAALYGVTAEYEAVESEVCQCAISTPFVLEHILNISKFATNEKLNIAEFAQGTDMNLQEISNINVMEGEEKADHAIRNTIFKFIGKAGYLGGLVSVVGKTVSGQLDNGKFGVTGAPNIVSLLKDGNSALKGLYKWQKSNDKLDTLARMLPEQAKKTGWKRVLGLDTYKFNGFISESSNWSTRFKNNVYHADGILDDFTSGGVKSVFAWAGVAFSAASNAYSNADEAISGEITQERAIVETVTETLVDTATGWAIGTAVAAGMVATVGAAPVVLVGAASVAVTMGVDWVCEKITGKNLTEAVSDGIIDTALMIKDGAVAVGNAICTGTKEVVSGVSDFVQSGWSKAKESWSSLKQGFKSLFA